MTEGIATRRLILRRWRASDREPFRSLNSDPQVMEFMPATLTPQESDGLIARIEQHFDQHGFIGLNVPAFEAPFMPAVEIGWRLAYDHWGRGLATEGACAVVQNAFETLQLPSLAFPSLVSFTVPANLRSRRVMEKIGMVHDPAGDFDHPHPQEGHRLRRHVLYRLHPLAGE